MLIHFVYNILNWMWGGYRFKSGAAGYNIMSGPLPDAVFLTAFYQMIKRHNCHVKGCPRIQFKSHPDDATHIVCKHHHPDRGPSWLHRHTIGLFGRNT